MLSGITVEPIAGALGAEVGGVDLSKPLNQETVEAIKEAFKTHLVIFFRNQNLDLEQQKAFASNFGILEKLSYVETIPGHPEMWEIIKEADEQVNVGDNWHIDQSHFEKPNLGSFLYAKDVPPYGGDTMWANMYLAYDTLSDRIKTLVDRLTCVHVQQKSAANRSIKSFKLKQPDAPPAVAEHPLVRTHPVTKKKSLFLPREGAGTFKELNDAEGTALMEMLQRHAENPDFCCRFRWKVNSLAFWDNRCTRHRVTADYFYNLRPNQPHRRHMQRVSIVGDRPF
ncbi:MAG: TauD/TfdA family dioxygenase [Rhizobiaceae bacterium]|nr:TauD/TfdA family dioxygenase [Rhizobiaceae bacterium]